MLLDAGTEVNARRGEYGNVLQIISPESHDKVMLVRLDTGTEVIDLVSEE